MLLSLCVGLLFSDSPTVTLVSLSILCHPKNILSSSCLFLKTLSVTHLSSSLFAFFFRRIRRPAVLFLSASSFSFRRVSLSLSLFIPKNNVGLRDIRTDREWQWFRIWVSFLCSFSFDLHCLFFVFLPRSSCLHPLFLSNDIPRNKRESRHREKEWQEKLVSEKVREWITTFDVSSTFPWIALFLVILVLLQSQSLMYFNYTSFVRKIIHPSMFLSRP